MKGAQEKGYGGGEREREREREREKERKRERERERDGKRDITADLFKGKRETAGINFFLSWVTVPASSFLLFSVLHCNLERQNDILCTVFAELRVMVIVTRGFYAFLSILPCTDTRGWQGETRQTHWGDWRSRLG